MFCLERKSFQWFQFICWNWRRFYSNSIQAPSAKCNIGKNYYEILGVPTTSNASTIRKSYFQKAKKFHPDQNPNDPEAIKKFVDCKNAYDVLTDQVLRKEYDQHIHLGYTHPHHHHHQSHKWTQYKPPNTHKQTDTQQRANQTHQTYGNYSNYGYRYGQNNPHSKAHNSYYFYQNQREAHQKYNAENESESLTKSRTGQFILHAGILLGAYGLWVLLDWYKQQVQIRQVAQMKQDFPQFYEETITRKRKQRKELEEKQQEK